MKHTHSTKTERKRKKYLQVKVKYSIVMSVLFFLLVFPPSYVRMLWYNQTLDFIKLFFCPLPLVARTTYNEVWKTSAVVVLAQWRRRRKTRNSTQRREKGRKHLRGRETESVPQVLSRSEERHRKGENKGCVSMLG